MYIQERVKEAAQEISVFAVAEVRVEEEVIEVVELDVPQDWVTCGSYNL